MIPFNKPSIVGKELEYIQAAVDSGKLSGNGMFTGQCHHFFEQHFGFEKVLLTHSGTAALEMAALLLDIQPGDEVIIPAYTFVSTANAFMLRGAQVVFADVLPDHPNIDTAQLEALITPRTKAIVVVHYGGHSVDMHSILDLSVRYRLWIVEDAAHAIGARYNGIPLGSIGHLAAFSFHETKNIHCGEGGMLVINDQRFADKADILWEKGTNRKAFFSGRADFYTWQGLGSSFLPSELNAAYLLAQTEHFSEIQRHRYQLWDAYKAGLTEGVDQGYFCLLPEQKGSYHNAHIMALVCKSSEERERLRLYLSEAGIMAVSHYRALHASPFFTPFHNGRPLPNSLHFEQHLLRLPLFHSLSEQQVATICLTVLSFYAQIDGISGKN